MSNGILRNVQKRPTDVDRIRADSESSLPINGGQIIDNIEIPVGKEVIVSHSLKTVPKGRIIIRQTGNLSVTDGPTAWTDKFLSLKAEGSVSKTVITILVLR